MIRTLKDLKAAIEKRFQLRGVAMSVSVERFHVKKFSKYGDSAHKFWAADVRWEIPDSYGGPLTLSLTARLTDLLLSRLKEELTKEIARRRGRLGEMPEVIDHSRPAGVLADESHPARPLPRLTHQR